MSLDLQVLKALQDEKPAPQDVTKEFRITRGAFAKAHLYAKLVCAIAGGGMECYGYLLKQADSQDDVVTNIYFADDQETSAAYVRVTEEGIHKTGLAVAARHEQILGWWHSHGNFAPFHSGTDVQNFEQLLHAIASQTMFKTEEAVYIADGDTVTVDRYRLDGFKPSVPKPRIIKKVERQPFAFSMVVNAHNNYYLETITKTYLPEIGEFGLNEPTRPRLTIVDAEGDIELDIREMEWEIYNKVRMDKHPGEERPRRYRDTEHRAITRRFLGAAKDYLRTGGEYSGTITNMLLAEPAVPRAQVLKAAEKGGSEELRIQTLDDEVCLANMQGLLQKSPFAIYRDANTKYKKFELENLVALQMMMEFSREGADRDQVIERYTARAKLLAECAEIAANATGALTRYAMEVHTDYKRAKGFKYKTLVANILWNMATERNFPLHESVRREAAKNQGGINPRLMLLQDRIHMANQLTRDLYYMAIGKCNPEYKEQLTSFLREFPETYMQRPSEVDGLIEKCILSMKQAREAYATWHDMEEHITYTTECRHAGERERGKIYERQPQPTAPQRGIVQYIIDLLPRLRRRGLPRELL